MTSSDIDLTDVCGEGTIIRTFVATDAAGNSNSCTQFITLVNADPFYIVDTECRNFGFPSTGNTILVPNPAFDPVFNPLVPEQLPVGPHSALDDVEWPCDIELTTCGLGLSPDDLEADFPQDARPYTSADACGNIGVGFEDLTLPVQGDACIKILRTWTIIDWCQFEVGNAIGDGIWEYVPVSYTHLTLPTICSV